jgi:hypothetical protein
MDQPTTNQISSAKEDKCLEQAVVDISEGKVRELEKSQEIVIANQDSFINGTFRLDNT